MRTPSLRHWGISDVFISGIQHLPRLLALGGQHLECLLQQFMVAGTLGAFQLLLELLFLLFQSIDQLFEGLSVFKFFAEVFIKVILQLCNDAFSFHAPVTPSLLTP